MVCSLGTAATMRSNGVVETTTVGATDHSTEGATESTTGVVICDLTSEISNGTTTTIQLIFDVVDIDDVDVRGASAKLLP